MDCQLNKQMQTLLYSERVQFKSVDFHICFFPFNSVSCKTADKIFLSPVKGTVSRFYQNSVSINLGRRFHPIWASYSILGNYFSPKGFIINGSCPRALREERTSSIRRPFKRVNREFIFSFREENVSHKITESFLAGFLANTMCKNFSSLKIKQTL